jgi:hypothetical protein
MGPIRQLIIIGFGVIQVVLAARILLDLGVLPPNVPLVDLIVSLSDALTAPVTAIVERFGAEPPDIGMGLNPAIVTALIGWSLIEAVVLMVLGRR